MPAKEIIEEIATERYRQIVKGHTLEADDTRDRGELVLAAASFALRAVTKHSDTPIFASFGRAPMRAERNAGFIGLGGLLWPWEAEFPHHTERRARLVKAAALLVAEIERLDRAGGDDAR